MLGPFDREGGPFVVEAARAHSKTAYLQHVASRRRGSIVDPTCPIDVSLASYGQRRMERVDLAISSIVTGRQLPGSLTLNVADEEFAKNPPPRLARLVERGLRILAVPDEGPHKKYRAVVADKAGLGRPLVTADDDVLYPRYWLAELLAAHRRHPNEVIGHRVHGIAVADGRLLPYAQWGTIRGTEPSFAHMATGGGGVLYPPAVRAAIAASGDGFVDKCLFADDLWLNSTAIASGARTRQVRERPMHMLPLPGLGTQALVVENEDGGGNDRAIAATYTAEVVARIAADAVRS